MTQGSTRRTVLATGAVALAAGCSDSNSGSTSTSSSAPAAPATTAATSSAPAAATSPPHSSAAGGELARTSDIPIGGGKVFKEQRVVVTQPSQGQFKAFSAVCTHQGCTVAEVADGTIDCPCHGSMFHIADGSVTHGPATSPLAARKIEVRGNSIRLT
ncbi:Rieske (2Fe-2S) protein [Streptomyces sp. NPDC047017]|uniref:Rieske (2Fe-2S) protein n=1 Tax=Streptomyces sp. NPDC047017 TaxID=3155024 RepID=UPI0033C7FF2D